MPKILNYGSLNIDYVYAVDHFVRPGETTLARDRNVFCGGKGLNQSIALARAGAQTYHAGAVGKEDGGMLLKILEESGVNTDYIFQRDCASGHTFIQVDSAGQNCILLYGGSNRTQTEAEIDGVFSHFSAGDYLVLQNEVNLVDRMMRAAKDRGMLVVLNPSPMDEKIAVLPLELCDYLLLNEVEAGDLCGGAADKEALLDRVCRKFPRTSIVLTLGGDGAAFKAPDMPEPIYHGIYDVSVADTTAAGDTFTGYFIHGVSTGKPAAEALRMASMASALAVSREGAAPSIPMAAEVEGCRLRLK